MNSFGSVRELANFILDLDRNDEKYNKYLEWKTKGLSKQFISVVDRAIVHSNCRLCIKVADLVRKQFGNDVGHEKIDKNIEGLLIFFIICHVIVIFTLLFLNASFFHHFFFCYSFTLFYFLN